MQLPGSRVSTKTAGHRATFHGADDVVAQLVEATGYGRLVLAAGYHLHQQSVDSDDRLELGNPGDDHLR